MQILSIQSHVAFGYVGNSAAVFPLQRLGHEVWPVLTVNFSNHTGYGEWRGPVQSASDVADVLAGIEERGVLPSVSAVLSGYQGDPAVGAVILDTVMRVKAANPRAIYCCDPVMGDVGRGFFVREGIPEFMREEVVPAADVITPNHFELDFLAGTETHTLEEVVAAADAVRAKGPDNVLVTSVVTGNPHEIDLVAVDEHGAWSVTTPLLPISPNGGGDVTAAVYLSHLLSGDPTSDALGKTANTLFAILDRTLRSGRRELELVASQDDIADPPSRFEVRTLR